MWVLRDSIWLDSTGSLSRRKDWRRGYSVETLPTWTKEDRKGMKQRKSQISGTLKNRTIKLSGWEHAFSLKKMED